MSSAPAPAEIAADATWLAQALDPAASLVRLVRMNSEDYRAASFLDDRLLQRPQTVQVVPWTTIEAAAAQVTDQGRAWIFHIGHVGSTLLARMLGELAGVLSVREPRLLRDLASVSAQRRHDLLGPIRAMLSRTFGPSGTSLVKATSFVSEIAPELAGGSDKALFLYARPSAYIESILAGENSLAELRILAPTRAQRMADRVAVPALTPQDDAALAALAWACEMTALEAAADRIGEDRIVWMDFDDALRRLPEALRTTAEFLGLDGSAGELEQIARGPLIRRYSKAMEYDYSPSLRVDLMRESRRLQGREIDAALGQLDELSERSVMLDRALRRSREGG